ncbi:MAG: hypothetical protein RMJ51_03420 [Candidatus Calescibacterium sp.]|nr:hypothetical protein [Candidatus Calescibacterium sp.]MCX7971669.1 hypothetical protein [bacterium]MDW8195275.1 hypothetical protein [Candidatus Calescibacterium sp.]
MDQKFKDNNMKIIDKRIIKMLCVFIFTISFVFSDEFFYKIDQLIQNGKYNEAIQILERNRQKIGIDYYTVLAVIYAHKGRDYNEILQKARKIFVDSETDTEKKDRNFSKILYTYGYIEYYINSDTYRAEIFLKESIKYNPNNDRSLITLAQINYDRNQTDTAEELLDRTFEILKTNNSITEEFLKIYNQVLLENRRYNKIAKIMKPYVDKFDTVKLFYSKALAYNSEYIEANNIIKSFLYKNNDNLEAYYILGLTYKDSKIRANEGLELIEKLNKEKNDRYYIKLAQFYEGLEDIDMAINYYDKALSINKNNDKYYILAITYAIDKGVTSRAINWAIEYYNKKPNDFHANLFLAICYEYQKQFDKSKEYYYRSIDIDPTRYESYVRLAWIVLEQEEDFNTCAEVLLKGYKNIKDNYYKNRIRKALKDLLELEEEYKKRYKQKTGKDIPKPISPTVKEQIKGIITE